MSTAELLLEKPSKLPDELQREALRYVDSLLARQAGNAEQGGLVALFRRATGFPILARRRHLRPGLMAAFFQGEFLNSSTPT